jgi:hypothetical protein
MGKVTLTGLNGFMEIVKRLARGDFLKTTSKSELELKKVIINPKKEHHLGIFTFQKESYPLFYI